MSQRLVVLGGSGFVGHHLLPRLAVDGHQIRLISRQCARHRELAVLPGLTLRHANVHVQSELNQAVRDADIVINLIGILNERHRQSFHEVHVELTRKLIVACHEAGIRRLHQMSALGAPQGLSQYLKTRQEADELVRTCGLDWTLYAPSVIFGEGDGLISRFTQLLRLTPVLPLARAAARLAPSFVGNVAEAIARGINHASLSRCRRFELFGPDVLSLKGIVEAIRDVQGRHNLVLPLPDWLGRLQAHVAEYLPGQPFSRDNFLSLCTDSVGQYDGYATLGITPQAFLPWLRQRLPANDRQRRLARARQHLPQLFKHS